MYQVLNEQVVKSAEEVITEYPGCAFLLINAEQPCVDGVCMGVQGNLYAVSDKQDYSRLCQSANELREQGFRICLDPCQLVKSTDTFFF